MWRSIANFFFASLLLLGGCSTCLGDVIANPDLPFGDINIIVVTDVHSFISGHPHELDRNADYGDVLSFYQHVKYHCTKNNKDLWFFMNGDWVHGTGLAMDGNATLLVPLLNSMPWDAINLGNHEAYRSALVESMRDSMIPHYGDAFLTSNTLDARTNEPFGNRFRLLKGKQHSLLVFGFLYDLPNPSSQLTVEKVESALEAEWFSSALRDNEYDAIVVLAHMDNDDPLVAQILHKIREHVEAKMPVQFLTGHTHERKLRKIEKDLYGRAMEAGGLLDTVGFLSIPTYDTVSAVEKKGDVHNYFQYEFLNASKSVLQKRSGYPETPWRTPQGQALSDEIQETRESLQLDEVIGCAPKDYFLNRSIHDEDSVYKLWMEHIVPTQIFERNVESAMIVSSDTFRYDVRGSGTGDAMTVDDLVAVVPYMEPVVYVGEVPERVVLRMNSSLNTYSMNEHRKVPDYLMVAEIEEWDEANKPIKLYTHEYNLPEVMNDLDRLMQHDYKPVRTGKKDTLYWLDYAQYAWQCKDHRQPKQVTPWFADIKELDDEDTDGNRDSSNAEIEMEKDLALELDQEAHEGGVDPEVDGGEGTKGNKTKNDLHYKGWEGYVAPSAMDQYGESLPPGMAPTVALRPDENVPTAAPVAKVKHSAAAHKAETREHRKKIRKILAKVFGGLMAGLLLFVPLYGLYGVLFPKQYNDMADETFYDMKEMRAMKSRKKKGRNTKGHQAFTLPSEIEIT